MLNLQSFKKHLPLAVIHDFHVPGSRLRSERYEGQRLDLEYVRDLVERINPAFGHFYNVETPQSKTGVVYFCPYKGREILSGNASQGT